MALKEALKHGQIQECITDRGTQFTKNDGSARFPEFIETQVLCRVNHPQTNGKAEIFNKDYTGPTYTASQARKISYNDTMKSDPAEA